MAHMVCYLKACGEIPFMHVEKLCILIAIQAVLEAILQNKFSHQKVYFSLKLLGGVLL